MRGRIGVAFEKERAEERAWDPYRSRKGLQDYRREGSPRKRRLGTGGRVALFGSYLKGGLGHASPSCPLIWVRQKNWVVARKKAMDDRSKGGNHSDLKTWFPGR